MTVFDASTLVLCTDAACLGDGFFLETILFRQNGFIFKMYISRAAVDSRNFSVFGDHTEYAAEEVRNIAGVSLHGFLV